MEIKHPKSEKTIIQHNYEYKGVKYVNDLGKACFYRVIKNNVDIQRVQYYGGRLLQVLNVAKQPL